jgi:hypothetical protein
MKYARPIVFILSLLGVPAVVLGQETLSNERFTVIAGASGLSSLKHTNDAFDTDYIQSGKFLGTLQLGYRKGTADWRTVRTTSLTGQARRDDSQVGHPRYQIAYTIESDLEVTESFSLLGRELLWTINLRNLTSGPVEVGDLAWPLVFNTRFPRDKTVTDTKRQLAHFWVSGHGSFVFLMRPNSVGPYLVITPVDDTKLEYLDADTQPGGGRALLLFIHSALTAARASERGGRWRQANTSVMLAPRNQPGDRVTYRFKCRWGDGYAGVRDVLYEENLFDVNIVPGMTVPSDLSALISLRTRNRIESLVAEFPGQTQIDDLGTRGQDNHLYKVSFSRLGENLLTIHFGANKYAVLEFFVTEPLETLIKKRSSFLVSRQQHRDPSRWYNGLFSDWDQRNKALRSPDDTDGLNAYIVACDDPGLCKAPFVASKNVFYPEEREIEAVDYYIHHYVWGGLQCTEKERHPYAIYGIPNWKINRDSKNPGRNGRLHLWRIYLSSWALLNSGTAESNYGYWYPGKENDGAAGGGFEPRAWATSWLRKSHPRGSWFYGCEIDLGFCGALRTAATIVADDPIFGRIAYGGRLVNTPSAMEVTPRDGLRQRLHVLRSGQRLHLILSRDGFAADAPITIDNALREIRFTLENRSAETHSTVVGLAGQSGRIAVEGRPAQVMQDPTGTRIELQVGPEARSPVRIRVKGPTSP